MQSPRPFVGIFIISLMLGISLVACQTTDSEGTGDTHALAFAFSGLSSHVYPDSATWDIAQKHGNGPVSRTSSSSIRIEAAIPKSSLNADTIWISLWTAGIRTARVPYLYANDSLYLLSGKIVKDVIAWNLLAARDSSKATDLTSLYARLLLNNDSRFSGFPLNCPTGLDTEAVKRAGLLYAVDSQGWSHGALPSLGMDSLEAATEKDSLTVSAPTFSPTSSSSTTAISVTLQCATAGSVIYYTTDNSEPTVASNIYTTPISLTASTAIKAIAMKSGMLKSSTVTSSYKIALPNAISKDSTLASLTTSPGGLMSTFKSSTTTYTDTVSANITSVTFTATATNSADVDSIRYNGAANNTITISKDTTRINVIVYNKNSNTMTYVVTVIRLHTTDYSTLKDDRDNNTYKIVTIGNQTWMAENLNYRDTGTENKDTIGACYNNSEDSCNKYGRLYKWSEAMHLGTSFDNNTYLGTETRGICPSGFHLPSSSEWDTLFSHSDTSAMKSLAIKGNDTSKFQLKLAGASITSYFFGIGKGAYFWTRNQLAASSSNNGVAILSLATNSCSKTYRLSVRCVKN